MVRLYGCITQSMTLWRNMYVALMGMKIAIVPALAAMMLPIGEPQFWAAITTVATVLGTIVLQILQMLKSRQDNAELQRRYDRDREEQERHRLELKSEVAKVAVVASAAASDLKADIRENTELTAQVGAKADAAYDAANGVNEKIVSVNEKILTLAGGKIEDVAGISKDTNATVHRIEDTVESKG